MQNTGLRTFQESFRARWATDRGDSPASIASLNSRNALAVIVANTVFTSDTFCDTTTILYTSISTTTTL